MSYLFDCIDTIQKFGDYPNQLFALEYGELEGNDVHEVKLNVTDDIWSLQELSPSSWSNPIAVYEFKGFKDYEGLTAEAKFVEQLEEQLKSLDGSPIMEWLAE